MAVEKLDKQEILGFLRPEQVDRLSKVAEVVKFKAGDTVYPRGAKANYFYIVLEGQVALRLPGKEGVGLTIDDLSGGAMFGGCVSFAMDAYTLTAQCMRDSKLLKIKSSVLKGLMDEDPRMGYLIQSKISEIYFKRYAETMQKLQAIVMNMPLVTE
ncbi:MAG: Crp/Fnr family transcriptional regulator [Elusimicrobia bacterium]|nr:Crp/Fnr family transcriptional regulator [Elusimicrobiota bacterium]